MAENVGTHVDARAHFVQGSATIDRIPLRRLIGPAAVVDVTDKVASDPDYRLRVADIERWERVNGRIPRGAPPSSCAPARGDARVIWPTTGTWMREKSCTFRASQRGQPSSSRTKATFRESGSIPSAWISVHPKTSSLIKIILGAGKFQTENLANLERLPAKGAVIWALPMNIRDGTQAEARVIALAP